DEVRYTVVDTNREKRPRSGFETGRVYSGLRGVVPMWADHNGETVHTGALEVGTSFEEMFRLLDGQLGVGSAALLKVQHVERNMWQSAIDTQFARLYEGCNCTVEASSRPGLEPLLDYYSANGGNGVLDSFGSDHLVVGGRHIAVTHWPLFDYYARSRDTGESVGAILMWRDISKEVAVHNASLRQNIIIAVISFLLLELLLLWSVRWVTRQLEATITERTVELDRANARLSELAQTDELTGLHNRRHFMALLEAEIKRSHRSGHPLTLAMADLDHFKQVNDRFGHTVGDHALQAVAGTLRQGSRQYDIVGRYGGEELTIVLPGLDLEEARRVLERLRQQVAALTLESGEGEPVSLTISMGVAPLRPGMNADELIDQADKLLYCAKEQGRNRLCLPADAPAADL
ncbi:MAG: diguanylate cyclase, partial [Pseudomonadota bacterium]